MTLSGLPGGIRLWPIIAAALASIFITTTPAIATEPEHRTWTRKDLDKVADAAVTSAAVVSDSNSHALMLLDLVDAFMRSGNVDRAKAILLQVSEILGPPNDFVHSTWNSRVVEKLAQLGDVVSAERLADAARGYDNHATLLGKIGEAQARAGDVAGALKTARSIASLPDATQKPTPPIANPKIIALAGIGGAFNDKEDVETALQIADSLPDGARKIGLLSRIGEKMCRSGDSAQVIKGRRVAEVAANATSVAPAAGFQPYEQRNWVVAAAGVIGICMGPDAVASLLHDKLPAEQIPLASAMVADHFAQNGEAALVRAVAPPVNPDDPDSLVDSAKRLLRVGDIETAKAEAMRASATALRLYQARLPPDGHRTVSDIFSLLVKVRSYDAAIESTLPIDQINRAQFYVSVVEDEINADDKSAVARSVPVAIVALKALSAADVLAQQLLTRMTIALARGRYDSEARQSFEALVTVRDKSLAADPRKRGLDTFIGVQAVMGDLPGILAEADRAGPLATAPDELVEAKRRLLASVLSSAMSSPNAISPPTKTELEDRFHQIQREVHGTLPPLVPGPKAAMLVTIASSLAQAGNVEAALQVESGLEGEPRDILRSPRDTALVAISDAQGRAGDPASSLATALRIEQPLIRWKPLLRLAAVTPNP